MNIRGGYIKACKRHTWFYITTKGQKKARRRQKNNIIIRHEV
tara:strand:+ start:684 stop:809 length:126 start_codon:yes stop_codon:yes gene_type:complete